MLHIIGVVVICKEAAAAVKALHQHALPVHVREAQRTVYGGAAQLPGPVLHCFKQGGGDLYVVNEIHLGEAQAVGAPLFIGFMAEYGADAADDLRAAHGQPAAGIAVGKGGVFLPVPILHIIAVGGGDELGHIFI